MNKKKISIFLVCILICNIFSNIPSVMALNRSSVVTEPPVSGLNVNDYFAISSGSTNSYIHNSYPNVIVTNPAASNQLGAIFGRERLDFSQSLQFSSHLFIAPISSSAGDGMTLTFHNDPRGVNAYGSPGQGLGAYPINGNVGIQNAISFEIDTHVNNVAGETDVGITESHMAFVYPSEPLGRENHHQLTYLSQTNFSFNQWHEFNFDWVPNSDGSAIFRVSVYGTTLEHRIDNYESLFGGTTGYFGFTSSTGRFMQVNAIAFDSVPAAEVDVTGTITNEKGDFIGEHGLTAAGHTLDYTYTLTKKGGNGIFPYHVRGVSFPLTDDLEVVGDATVTLPDNTQLQKTITSPESNYYEIPLDNRIVPDGGQITVTFKVRVKDGRYDAKIEQMVNFHDLANQNTSPKEPFTYYLISANSIIDLDNKVAIEGFNRAIHINDIGNLNSEDAILGYMGASTRSILDSRIPMQSRTSQTSIPAQVGIVPFDITDASGITKKPVELYVYDDTAVINDTYLISANNFNITSEEATSLSDNTILTKADAKARNILTGNMIDPIIKESKIEPVAGVYPVVIGISEDASLTLTIYVTVIDDNTVINDIYGLRAENFTITSSEVGELSDDIILKNAESVAWNIFTGENIDPIVSSQNIKEEIGVYPVVIGIKEDATLTREILVTVVNDNTVINDSYALAAENFMISIDEVEDLDILNKSYAKAWNINTGEDAQPIIISQGIVKEAGVYPVVIGVKEDTSLTKTIFVTVIDENTVIDDTFGLRAENFTISNTEVSALTNQLIIIKSQAKAWNMNTGEAAEPMIHFQEIKEEAGVYPVVIGIDEDTTLTMTIFVTVINENTEINDTYALTAENFMISIDEVEGLDIIRNSNARAWNIQTGDDIDPIVISQGIVEEAGVYPVVIGIDEDQTLTKTIYVTVTDENTETNDNYALTAENFMISIDEVEVLDIIRNSNARAWNMQTGDNIDPIVISQAIVEEAGVYPVVIGIREDASLTLTIYVTVTDESTVIDDTYGLRAENFIITSSEVSGLTDGLILINSRAKAWNIQTGENIDPIVVSHDIEEEAGVYPVILGIDEDTTLTKTIYVTVTDENTVINDTYAITAENFTVSLDEVENLDIIRNSNARAWNMQTGDTIDPIAISQAIVKEAGVYPVVIGIREDASLTLTIYVTVTDENTVIDNTFGLRAENFTITNSEVRELTNALIILKSQAMAWNIQTGDTIDPIVISQEIKEVVGVYPVVIGIEEDSTLTKKIMVTVVDENTVINDTYAITAENFMITIDEVEALDIIRMSSARAWNIITGEEVDVIIKAGEIEKQAGVYEIVIGINEDEITKMIYVTVTDENTVIDDTFGLHAENFTITSSEVRELTDEIILLRSQANVWNIHTGETNIDPIVRFQEIKDEVGVYPVVIGIEEDSTLLKTIWVTVVDENTIVNNRYALTAQNVSVSIEEVEEVDIISKSNARAWNLHTGEEVEAIVQAGEVKKQVGVYEIIIGLEEDEITKTIYVTVTDDSTVINETYALRANNFSIHIDQINDILDIDSLSNVHAWNIQDPYEIVPYQLLGELKKELGLQELTYVTQTDPSVSKTIQVFVYDDDSMPNQGYIIYGNNITVLYSEKHLLSLEEVIQKGNLSAYHIASGEEVSDRLVVNSTDLTAIQTTQQIGLHPLRVNLSTMQRNEIGRTIYVDVIDDRTTLIQEEDGSTPILETEKGNDTNSIIDTGDDKRFTAVVTLLGSIVIMKVLQKKRLDSNVTY